jgi:hypothetical protein
VRFDLYEGSRSVQHVYEMSYRQGAANGENGKQDRDDPAKATTTQA